MGGNGSDDGPLKKKYTGNPMTEKTFISRALIFLRFRAKQNLTALPHYHGPQWNGFFRSKLKAFIDPEKTMHELRTRVHPADTGIHRYAPGDPMHVGLSFPFDLLEGFFNLFHSINRLETGTGVFHSGTMMLEQVQCRISGNAMIYDENGPTAPGWGPERIIPLSTDIIEKEALELCRRDHFTLRFHAPLCLKSSGYKKSTGHGTAGADFFSTPAAAPLEHLLKTLGVNECRNTRLKIQDAEFVWHDSKYGKKFKGHPDPSTTLGGILGQLQLQGTLTLEEARCLTRGQYLGIGKSRAFGFGFFHIPEIRQNRQVAPIKKSRTVLGQAARVSSLAHALKHLPNSSPGPDGLGKRDIESAGECFLEKLGESLESGTFRHGPVKTYKKKKKRGYRRLHVFNVVDKVIHRAVANALKPVAEGVLSEAAFAYRTRRSRKDAVKAVQDAFDEGFTTGIKADIKSFFNAVDPDILCRILAAFLPFDDLSEFIDRWLSHCRDQSIEGLPQGSPLSPVLSNLYLDRFDRQMIAGGFRCIRYGDDFILLHKDGDNEDHPLSLAANTLAALGLELQEDKTLNIDARQTFTFLGFDIQGRVISDSEKIENKSEDLWLPVFTEELLKGCPVYLTSLCRGAFSSGPSLVVKDESGESREIVWRSISRIVVVGRSSFSSGVVYRALQENIPVTFIDIWGRMTGQVFPSGWEVFSNEEIQKQKAADPDFCLKFAGAVIQGKILNSHVLLQRNNSQDPRLKEMARKAVNADSLEQLRGYEGNAASLYFKAMKRLVPPFEFEKRVFHPPDNEVNALLSFGYTLLYNRLSTALADNGLNPRIGFLHKSKGRHNALASDLMEELRHVVDRIVLALIHLKEIEKDDFTVSDYRGKTCCSLKGNAFRKYIQRYESVMASTFKYGRKEPISYNTYLDETALKLIRAMKLSLPYESLRIK